MKILDFIRKRSATDNQNKNGDPQKSPIHESILGSGSAVTCLTDTVPRLYFGRIVTAPQHADCGEQAYVLGFGKKPVKERPAYLREIGKEVSDDMDKSGDTIYQQLTESIVTLRKYTVPIEEGPYADKDGLVSELADEIAKGADNEAQLADRVIDILRPVIDAEAEMRFPRVHTSKYTFSFNEHFGMLPDELPSAGNILAHKDRLVMNRSTGAQSLTLAHVMEPYMLAVSALRRNSVNAYPALAVMPAEHGQEAYSPLIVLVDLAKEVPLTTFALMRSHPPMGSIDVISDVAMIGVTFTMLAEQRVKHLTMEMVTQSREGRTLSSDEVENQLMRISDVLFECHKVWPGTHFISDSLNFIAKDVYDAFTVIQMAEAQDNWLEIVSNNPIMTQPGMIEQLVDQNSRETAANYRNIVIELLSQKVALLHQSC